MSPAHPPAKFRIYIVDSHSLVRRGLSDLIGGQHDMEVCGEAEDARTGFSAILQAAPDIVTTEISLSGYSGLELIKSIRRLERNIGILVISMCDEIVYAERALRAGAHGFVSKHTGIGTIADAIRQILTGRFAFTPAAQQRMVQSLLQSDGRQNSSVRGLTDRELEIGTLIGNGASTREIATRLGVSVKTVETHRSRIKEKLALPNAGRLMQFWVSWAAHGETETAPATPEAAANGNHTDEPRPAAPNGVTSRRRKVAAIGRLAVASTPDTPAARVRSTDRETSNRAE